MAADLADEGPAAHEPEWRLLSEAVFEAEGRDHLATFRAKHPTPPADEEGMAAARADFERFVSAVRIRFSTLLKTDSVSVLLGAGASRDAGGVLLGAIPAAIERILLDEGVEAGGDGSRTVAPWLRLIYQAAKLQAPADPVIPANDKEILERAATAGQGSSVKVNYEALLSQLFRWHSALSASTDTMRISGPPVVEASQADLETAIAALKKRLLELCRLPASEKGDGALEVHRTLLRKLLSRPRNLRRVKIFSLNYDTLIEQAADAEGVHLLDGFVGTIKRVFRPESYGYDLYFPGDTSEGDVHRLGRVLHLYKLHGSIDWRSVDPSDSNPFGLEQAQTSSADLDRAVVYPTPAKERSVLGLPYSEMFRRLADALVRPQSTLFVVGYSFGDPHVNAIIRQALATPSFTLIVVDPAAPVADPMGGFVSRLRALRDPRVWVVSGWHLGAMSSFVGRLLPNLSDEAIRQRILEAQRALGAPEEEA